ncbi:hypothetical protein C4565_01020 [Candidatus Parcubacteria bacterium]|nr:MAG: hypothetical protein C4565_01020 [Candidatus Parcubacteria bacterium]
MLSVVTLFLSAGVLFVYGQNTYVGPSAPFPSGLVDKPVDTSNAGQEKSGDLNLKTLRFGLNTDPASRNITLSGKIGNASDSSSLWFSNGALVVDSAGTMGGLALPFSGSDPVAYRAGSIYYNTGAKKVKLYTPDGWTDIGTGSGVATSTFAPTVKINGGSGTTGLLLNMTGTGGENSPMIMFSVYGNAPVSMFSDEKIAKSFLENLIPRANAMLPACDTDMGSCGGGGGGGGGGGYIDPLTKPIWWMRQEGTKFVIKASNPTYTDVREAFELTKAGTLSTNDVNLVNPKWSMTGSEIQSTGGQRSYSPDGHMENWVTCPDGYFVSAFRLGKSGDYLTPVIRCSKL